MRDNRGVSEILGFVLMFAILTASIGIVVTFGFGHIEQVQEAEEMRGARNGMIALAESFGDVQQRTDLSREAGLSLGGGNLDFEESRLTVEVDGNTYQRDVWALEHRLNDNRVVYEGGGLFVGAGGIVDRQPALSCDPDRGVAVVSLLEFQPTELYFSKGSDTVPLPDEQDLDQGTIRVNDLDAVSGEGSIVLQASHIETSVLHRQAYDSPRDVRIDYSQAATPAGWNQLGEKSTSEWTTSGSKLVCSNVDRVLVRTTTVGVEIST